MNSARIACVLFFLVLFPAVSFGQEKAGEPKPAAANPGLKTIFSYSKELGLSEKQVGEMKGMLVQFQKYLNDKGGEIKELNAKLREMVKQKAELGAIRKVLERISALQVDVSYADIETSRKVESALTPGQLKKWNAMQDSYRKQEAQARQMQQLQKGRPNKQ